MSDLVENHIVGFPTRAAQLCYLTCASFPPYVKKLLLYWMTQQQLSSQPMVELSIILEANSNFCSQRKCFFSRYVLGLKL